MSNPVATSATPNPYPTTPTEIDIRETADPVIAMLEQQRPREPHRNSSKWQIFDRTLMHEKSSPSNSIECGNM